MNIIDAKKILLSKYVEHLGGRYAKHDKPHVLRFYSPFRPTEKTPSFIVNRLENRWYDFGHSRPGVNSGKGCGGDIIDLWCDYHGKDRRTSIPEALAAIEGHIDVLRTSNIKLDENENEIRTESPRFEIIKLHRKIFYSSLKEEINRRGISHEIANLYLQQAFIRDNEDLNRKVNGLAFKNDKNGFEICIPNSLKETCFKTTIKPKTITTIEGVNETEAIIFEGFWDYLTWLQMNKLTKPHCIVYVLNSVSFAGKVAEQIKEKKTIKTVHLFLDNDNAGFQALHSIAGLLEEDDILICDKSPTYEDHKDLNDYWRHGIHSRVISLAEEKSKEITPSSEVQPP